MRLPLPAVTTLTLLFVSLHTVFAQFANDTYFLTAPTCDSFAELCSDFDAQAFADHTFFIDGVEVSSAFEACASTGGARFEFEVGSHVIEAFLAGVLQDAAAVDVQCVANPPYVYVALYVPTAQTICPDLSALTGPVARVTTAAPLEFVTIDLAANDCFTVVPVGVGVDSVALTYCDAADNCSTAYYVFDSELANPISSTTVFDTVAAPGGVVTYCINTQELPGNITSVTNACPDASGTFVDFDLNENTVCLKYTGLQPNGIDTACVVVCDNLGFCDTTTVIVSTGEPAFLPEVNLAFVVEEGVSTSVVLNVSALSGQVVSVINGCPLESGTFVDFTFEDAPASVNFSGLAVGVERACVDVTDDAGTQQRFNVQVTVIAPRAISDTVRLRRGDTRLWCYTNFSLTGPPTDSYDDCPAVQPVTTLNFLPDPTCLEITGDVVGTQQLCIVICDANGTCDRRLVIVEVIPNSDDRLPLASDDFFILDPGGVVLLDPLFNDRSQTDFTFAQVIRGPAIGTARFTTDLLLEYELTGDCDQDELVYEVCNVFGCDQATVTLANNCDGQQRRPAIIVRKGFSPNGDGVNDTWTIDNIEFYPENRITVFNRWGAEVFQFSRYSNQWDGTFDDQRLPDGTYFYVAELGEGEPVAGYVHIRR